MKINLDFNEVLDAYCDDQRKNRYNKPSIHEIAEQCCKLLDLLPSYGDEAQAIKLIIDHSDTIKTELLALLED